MNELGKMNASQFIYKAQSTPFFYTHAVLQFEISHQVSQVINLIFAGDEVQHPIQRRSIVRPGRFDYNGSWRHPDADFYACRHSRIS